MVMPALKTIRNAGNASDPYCYMAICVFEQTFRDIASYFSQVGTKEDRQEGYRSIKWIKKMAGNFRLLSGASNEDLSVFHQKCLKRIADIRTSERVRQEILNLDREKQNEG